MDSSDYPREADSDSEEPGSSDDSTHKMEEEDPLYSLTHTPNSPPHLLTHSPPHPLTHSPLHTKPSPPSSPPPTFHQQPSAPEDLLCTICTSLLHEPMSLHCGHTFCQLCLAAMWHSSHETISAVELKCPVCRSSWRNFPGINIQLRSIIERTYPHECSKRRESLLHSDQQLLARFKSVREKESQLKDKLLPSLRREEITRLVTTLLCVFGAVLAVLILLFIVVFWAWVGAEGKFMRKPVNQWSQRDVAEWVRGLGTWASSNYSDLFQAENINGPRLLDLDETALITIGIKDAYRRQSILYGIQELKDVEFNTPRNFNEFKAAHRRETLMVALFYHLWPRLTLLHSYVFFYYDIFLLLVTDSVLTQRDSTEDGVSKTEPTELGYVEELAVLMAMLVFPHLLVALFAWQWTELYPLLAYPVLVHCMLETWGELRGFIRRIVTRDWGGIEQELTWRARIRAVVKLALVNCLFFTLVNIVVSLVWHITPHFLCDLLFHYLIWHTLLVAIVWSPLRRICGVRRPQGNFRIQVNFNRPRVHQGQA